MDQIQAKSIHMNVNRADLNLAAMKRSMGRRAFRRSVSDAGLGAFRPTLTYKAERVGVNAYSCTPEATFL